MVSDYSNQIIQGEALEVLKGLPSGIVQTCITSPPYCGLRSYLPDNHPDKSLEIGMEETPQAYVEKLVQVFREVKRVLRDDGTCWLNLGDSYGAHKQLLGIPWKVAFALQDDGWILRADCIWSKPNCLPESVRDRPTKSHEYVFLLAKNERYYYDQESIREPHISSLEKFMTEAKRTREQCKHREVWHTGDESRFSGGQNPSGRNKRTVWDIPTTPFSASLLGFHDIDHFAVMPPKLVEPCILAGSSSKCCEHCGAPWERVVERGEPIQQHWAPGTQEKVHHAQGKHGTTSVMNTGTIRPSYTTSWQPTCTCPHNTGSAASIVLDPFCGAGTTPLVALQHQRNYLGIELNPSYIAMVQKRLETVQPHLWDAV